MNGRIFKKIFQALRLTNQKNEERMRMTIEDYAEYLSHHYKMVHGPIGPNCKKSCCKFKIGYTMDDEVSWYWFKFGGHCLGKGSWYNIMGADLKYLERHVIEFFNKINKPKE